MPRRLAQDADGIKCPACGSRESDVVDSRGAWGMRGRRRKCNQCGVIFKTYEVVIPVKWRAVFVSFAKMMFAYRRQGPRNDTQR